MSRDPSSHSLTVNRLVLCIAINQLATPGLGSWMAGRKFSGAGQLALSVTGFLFTCLWMLQMLYAVASTAWDNSAPPRGQDWMWSWGLWLFGAGWVWALITSISLGIQAKRLRHAAPGATPPKLPS